ncbi:MAG: cobalamin biosynthesis protein [Desulfovibrio sp.]|jgi:cobalt-precorrin 5A hydrolase|nr:cobalamin biosynthesis protein [Desulfovibrio sp.]
MLCHALSSGALPLACRLLAALDRSPWSPPGSSGGLRCRLSVPKRFVTDGPPGNALEAQLASAPDSVATYGRLRDFMAREYHRHKAHVFVGAIGIAVRSIAPLLIHKRVDPPVVVMDAAGNYAVSVLSGHWGGGNGLARHISRILGPAAVITTASDSLPGPSRALDELLRDAGLAILDWDALPRAQAALLEGHKLTLWDPCRALGENALFTRLPDGFTPGPRRKGKAAGKGVPAPDDGTPIVTIHWRVLPPSPKTFRVAVPRLHVGVGCRLEVAPDRLMAAFERIVKEEELEPAAIASIATVAPKATDAAIVGLARSLGLPLKTFPADKLVQVPTPNPSGAAGCLFGCRPFSVCESAAMMAAGWPEASLVVPKRRIEGSMTLAVAVSGTDVGDG